MTPFGAIAASAALGFFKSLALGRHCAVCPPKRASVHSVLLGPAQEELIYRASLLHLAGTKKLPVGFTAIPFAVDHILPEVSAGASLGRVLFRGLEVALGGYLYESAYREGGYFAAVAAHAAHNFMAAKGFNAGLNR